MRRTLFFLASVVVSGIFLWLALRGVPLDEVMTSIRTADPFWVLMGFLTMSAGLWARAWRWRGLLDFKIPYFHALHILNIGFLLNQLPLRAGEVARVLLVTRSNVPLVTAATSVVVERMLDTLLVVLMLVWAIVRLPDAPAAITAPTAMFGIAVVVAFIILIIFARYPDFGKRTVAFLQRLLPFLKRLPLEKMLDNMLTGLKPLTHWRSGLHAVVWTVISWAISLTTVYSLARALNIADVDMLLLSVLGLTLASFSIAIPVSVAAIGPYEAAVKVAGQAVGLSETVALSLGFLFHGVNIIGYAIWGVIGLLVMGVSLSDVVGQTAKTETTETSAETAGT
jgi:uncharacterized protein (TIRG00374 family)